MSKREEDFREYYEIIGVPIGIGGFGKVYKTKEKEKNVKIIDFGTVKEIKDRTTTTVGTP